MNNAEPVNVFDNSVQVINTRPFPMGELLSNELTSLGISNWHKPAIFTKFISNQDFAEHGISLNSLFNEDQWLLFVSRTAVSALFSLIQNFGSDADKLINRISTHPNVIAVGKGTAEQLASDFSRPLSSTILPSTFNSEGVLMLPELQDADLKPIPKVLNIKGIGGREVISDELVNRGFEVSEWPLYTRKDIHYITETSLWQSASIIVLTSNDITKSILHSLSSLDLNQWQWVVFGDRVKTTLLKSGVNDSQIYICEQMDNSSIIKHIQRLLIQLRHSGDIK